MSTQIGYKASELGMIPQDWDVVKLGDVFEVTAGGDLDVTNFSAEKTHKHIYPVYSNAITDNGLYGFSSNYDCCGNHITVTARGYIGYAVPRNGKFSSIGRLLTLQPKTEISCYLVAQYINQFVSFAIESTGVPQLTAPQIKKYLVAIPKSTTEQTAIATALSDTDELISSLQTLIAKKKAIKLSAMQNLLSGKIRLPEFAQRTDGSPKTMRQTELGLLPEDWEIRRVGDFTDCTAGGTPSTQVSSYWGGEIPWMSSGELHLKQVYDVVGRITEKGLENSSTKFVPANSVLIGLAGQGKTRGTVAISKIPLCTNQSIAAIFPTDEFNSTFLFYNLENRYDELRALSTGDGGRGGLNLTIIRNVLVKFPSLPEQTTIAQLLSDMDAEIEALECRLKKTQALKQGMMQALLTGKIRLPLE